MKKIETDKIEQIINVIKENDKFLITAHMNLEGDALGSELALYLLLKKLNKKVIVYNHDLTPEIYEFLPQHEIIKNSLGEIDFNVIFALDCSAASRTGKVEEKFKQADLVVNIDHHVSNTNFGDLNWVEPNLSSASEMIYYLAKKLKIMDKNIALCLYTGIFTDSGSFTYASTSPDTHKVVADLMQFEIKPHLIYNKIHSLCNPGDIKFIGECISKLKFNFDKRICWIAICKWKKKQYDLTEIIFSIMRLLKSPEVFVFFKKIGENKTRINFRSCSDIDVNKIAKFFDGGGHQKASGTTLNKDVKESEKEVISVIKKQIND